MVPFVGIYYVLVVDLKKILLLCIAIIPNDFCLNLMNVTLIVIYVILI